MKRRINVNKQVLSKKLVSTKLIHQSGADANERFIEFFTANLRNQNTRKAYFAAVTNFLDWSAEAGVSNLQEVGPIHVATWLEALLRRYSIASAKLKLAALKEFFDWLVVTQIIATNPAASVKSPRQVIKKGKTPVLQPDEARKLINAIDVSQMIGLRDRALIGTMLFTFARIGAALSIRVGDVYSQNCRLWVRLHEKGGKLHDMPCHHELEDWLATYMTHAGITEDRDGWLFRSIDRRTKILGTGKLAPANAYAMVRRRARAAGVNPEICNHTFRATGITAYLMNSGTLETAAKMANHASTRTTQLYDRRNDEVTLGEVERIRF